MSDERLHKYLAGAGISSRRHAEELILAGRVSVNGKRVTELGTKADYASCRVEVDGRRVVSQPFVYVLMHKPRGTVTTLHDPEGRPTVAGLIANLDVRILPIGRLDYATSGVLLMTNDGEFLAKLQHASQGVKKVYHAKVRGLVDARGLDRWRRSINIQGRATRPADVKVLQVETDKTWLEIAINEGKNRQIRRLGDQVGHPVLRLLRVEYAGLTVTNLRPGHWRYLTKDELLGLKRRYGVPGRIPRVMPAAMAAPRRASMHASKSRGQPRPHRRA